MALQTHLSGNQLTEMFLDADRDNTLPLQTFYAMHRTHNAIPARLKNCTYQEFTRWHDIVKEIQNQPFY